MPRVASGFVVKDSGKRVKFSSGMRRDTDDGKPRYDLIDDLILERLAVHLAKGAKKYGEDNWRLANTIPEYKRFIASAFRHFMQWKRGDRDEDHAAAVIFNITAAENTMAQYTANQSKRVTKRARSHTKARRTKK